MASRLKNILNFTVPGGSALALPHGLNWQSRPVRPDVITPEESGSTLTFTANLTDVTATNSGPQEAVMHVLVESWHTIERSFEDVANKNLVPQPFVSGRAGESLLNSAPVTTIVYRPGDPDGSHDNVYTTWAGAYGAIESVRNRGRIMLEFDSRYTSPIPCLIPPGTWNMAGVGWTAPASFVSGVPSRAEIMDGARFVMQGPEPESFAEFFQLHGNVLQIIFNGRYPGPGPNQGGTGITPFMDEFLGFTFVGSVTQLMNTDEFAAPMIKVSPDIGAIFMIMQGSNNSVGSTPSFAPAVSPAPVLDANGGFVEFEMGGGNIHDNALMDSVGGGFFFIHLGDDNACGGQVGIEQAEDGVAPTYDFPAIDPLSTFISWRPQHRARMLLRTDAGAAGYAALGPGPVLFADSPYDAAYNELVIADSTGGNIAVNAPRAFPAKGERLVVKNLAAALFAVTVVPAPVVLPQHPFVDVVESPIVGPGLTKSWIADGLGTWVHVSST